MRARASWKSSFLFFLMEADAIIIISLRIPTSPPHVRHLENLSMEIPPNGALSLRHVPKTSALLETVLGLHCPCVPPAKSLKSWDNLAIQLQHTRVVPTPDASFLVEM